MPASERERLIAAMDRYLDALASRDMRHLPITPSLRCTENTRELPIGAGLWRTVRGIGPRGGAARAGHCFVDIASGNVEYWGAIDEMGADAIYGVRLRIEGRMDPAQLDRREAHRALGVAEQMTSGHYSYIEALRARRFPIVDEERGLVVCHVLFDHPGDIHRSDGELPFRWPNSMLAYEVFKVRAGVLEEVWAIGTALPYGIGSGWQT